MTGGNFFQLVEDIPSIAEKILAVLGERVASKTV